MMKELTFASVEDIAPYEGPHAIAGIRFRHARRTLGVSAWGMNILEFDPDTTGYPQHDHQQDAQEEVYVLLRGAVILQVGDEERELSAGEMVRVPPHVSRKLVTRTQPATILALGATPGKAYEPDAM
ncbi:MAG: cupin domain-containing protein [Myxococcales bacterium]|nr:cupin domain-containing protein [Myxococcales bacterium]MDD9969432.1 cupin domain-containing protein [Myxococcales bacterium]